MTATGVPDLACLARRQGERAARFASGPEVNPFDAEGEPGRAWEAGRAEEAERRNGGDLLAWRQRSKRRARA